MVDDVADLQRKAWLESVAEYDEGLMEKYFEDPDSITRDEIVAALESCYH